MHAKRTGVLAKAELVGEFVGLEVGESEGASGRATVVKWEYIVFIASVASKVKVWLAPGVRMVIPL
jgi:hypothetical protein